MPEIKDLLYIVIALITIGAYVYTWLTNKSKANESSIEDIVDKLAGHDTRLSVVESNLQQIVEMRQEVRSDIKELRGEIGTVHNRIDTLAGMVARTDGQLKQIGRSLDVLVKAHIEDAAK